MGRRSGFTLIETLLAVIIVSVMTLMAYPRVNSAITRSNLRGARTRVVNMLSVARVAATQGRTAAYLRFNGNMAVVTAEPRRALVGAGTEDTLGLVVNLNAVYGATVGTGGMGAVKYDPRGLASGFDATNGTTIYLTHGSYSQSIKLDQLGRVK